MMDEHAQAFMELNGKLERMINGIDTVKEKQMEMAEDIGKIKEAVYNPDEGIYARLRELESWKGTSSKLIWLIITTVIALAAASIWRMMISGI
jgi:ABC-type multidrug transport system fused ATPase/permease subunit